MSYQLRSRKDPASLDTQEQTDTLEGNLAETQVATSGYEIVVRTTPAERCRTNGSTRD